ncbi:hypothetical protein CIB48_g2962 [Xylaria polymorpha]|nr:hypothetical protein CIB48_g2962 [Xylaria polymorpha]
MGSQRSDQMQQLLSIGAIDGLYLNETARTLEEMGIYHPGETALISLLRHEKVVKILLDKGADVNSQGEEYDSALQVASDRGHKQVAKKLLEKGAKYPQAEYANSFGDT